MTEDYIQGWKDRAKCEDLNHQEELDRLRKDFKTVLEHTMVAYWQNKKDKSDTDFRFDVIRELSKIDFERYSKDTYGKSIIDSMGSVQ